MDQVNEEIWKDTEYKYYEVSNMGKVRNKTTLKVLKPETRELSAKVNLWFPEKELKVKVAIKELVASCFKLSGVGENIWHKDYDISNNSVENLYYTEYSPRVILKMKGYIGEKFGRLTLIQLDGKVPKGGDTLGKFKCECGTTKTLRVSQIIKGVVSSCGCLRVDNLKEHQEQFTVWGKPIKDIPETKVYYAMLARCRGASDKGKKNYMDTGVEVCERWCRSGGEGLRNFLEDMGPRPKGFELDRIDTYGDYTPENCRWAERSLNQFNKRLSSKNKSGRTGVCWCQKSGKWRAYIGHKGKHMSIGLFSSLEEAIKAREVAEVEYYGEIKNE